MSSRYYDSCNSDAEIKPGQISAELREALNLPENDIPIWIYRMRALGYPPGWLKKAVVDTNDIFDTDAPTEKTGSNKRKSPSEEVIQYDHSKLIEYPGFNAPMPKNCDDYHYYVNMPAMLGYQQLEYAKKHMSAFKPVKIPKRIRITTSNNNDSINSLDGSQNASSTDQPSNIEGPDSPDNEEESSNDALPSDSNSQANKSNLSKSLSEEIKLVSKGSPMPKPVERAPLEKFSEGVVGDLLYFENIPSSTGKFDSLRGLLNTMRRSRSEADASFEATTPIANKSKDDEK